MGDVALACFRLMLAGLLCCISSTTASGAMVVAVLDLAFVNLAMCFPGSVRPDQAQVWEWRGFIHVCCLRVAGPPCNH